MEQVCRALHELSRGWLRRQRGSSDRVCLLDIIAYHQERNRAARLSKQKKIPVVRGRKKRRPPKHKRKNRCTVRSK